LIKHCLGCYPTSGGVGGASIAALEKRKTSVYIQPDAADSIARVKTRIRIGCDGYYL
jgi:hypothetical protein